VQLSLRQLKGVPQRRADLCHSIASFVDQLHSEQETMVQAARGGARFEPADDLRIGVVSLAACRFS